MIILPYPIRETERELQETLSLEADCRISCRISCPQSKLLWANSLLVDGTAAGFEVAEGKCVKRRSC